MHAHTSVRVQHLCFVVVWKNRGYLNLVVAKVYGQRKCTPADKHLSTCVNLWRVVRRMSVVGKFNPCIILLVVAGTHNRLPLQCHSAVLSCIISPSALCSTIPWRQLLPVIQPTLLLRGSFRASFIAFSSSGIFLLIISCCRTLIFDFWFPSRFYLQSLR